MNNNEQTLNNFADFQQKYAESRNKNWKNRKKKSSN